MLGKYLYPIVFIMIIIGVAGAYSILYASGAGSSGLISSTDTGNKTSPNIITHIVVIMQENRAFDNYFGTFPNATEFNNNTCEPIDPNNLSKGCVKPFLITNPSIPNMAHDYISSMNSIDKGKMDGFIKADKTVNAMSYYDSNTIPYYWEFAGNFVLADHFFSSAISYSLPNHWYLIAANSPSSIFQTYNEIKKYNNKMKNVYLNQSNRTATIADSLLGTNVTWTYYDHPLDNTFANAVTNNDVYNFWNPFRAKETSYVRYPSHFVNRTQIFNSIKNGTLPNVSFVMPSNMISEHAPANIIYGMYWSTSVIDAIENSTYWNHTVIVVTWDDYGGYYDNVVPPVIDKKGLGIRVPALIISPYAKNHVDHRIYSFESILKFIETRWNRPPLTSRDRNANNIIDALDFNQSPRKPLIIPLNEAQRMAIEPYLSKDDGVD